MEGTKGKLSVCVRYQTQTGSFFGHAQNRFSVDMSRWWKMYIFPYIGMACRLSDPASSMRYLVIQTV